MVGGMQSQSFKQPSLSSGRQVRWSQKVLTEGAVKPRDIPALFSPDSSERWLRDILNDKKDATKRKEEKVTHDTLRKEINKTLRSVMKRDSSGALTQESKNAQRYLDRFYNRVIGTMVRIEREQEFIAHQVQQLKERTALQTELIRSEKRADEKLWQKIGRYVKSAIGYVIKVAIPIGAVRTFEELSKMVKEIEFWKKAVVVISIYVVEEWIVREIIASRYRKKIEKIQNESAKAETRLHERSARAIDWHIEEMKSKINADVREIFGDTKV